MSAFIKILSKFIPNIDITSPAYIYSDDSKILINSSEEAPGITSTGGGGTALCTTSTCS